MKSLTQILLLPGVLLLFFSACSPDNGQQEVLPGPLSESHILEHVEVLASDEFGGRSPGTVYEEMTVDYITEQFQRIGLEPGMPGENWTQPVPLMGQQTRNARMRFYSGDTAQPDDTYSLEYQDDFMAWPAHIQEEVAIDEAELVYVGYGIEAPEESWDDFKGVDVSNKVLVFKNFNPVTYEDRFDGGNRLYYGRWTYKFEKAIEKGALGAIIIHTDETAGYGWDIVRNSWSRERFFVFDEAGHDTQFSGWMTREKSEELFTQAGLDLDEMLDAAEDMAFEPVPLEDVRLDLSLDADYRSIEGQNVVGKLTGSDPDLADEAVIFSAHHDHLGQGEPVEGDSIFNGAWDNASGVSLMINMARLFEMETGEIRRSLYFVAVTAEESGLLGSQYFAENAPVHPGKVSANINLDATNIYGETSDIVAIGYGLSDIDPILEEVAAEMGRTVKPDPNPEQGIYYRSDHFSFARQGIPALYPNPGTEFVDKPDNYNEQVAEYRSKIYHTVHDRVHDWWDLSGAIADMKVIYQVTKRIANEETLRRWQPGSEFEQARLHAIEEAYHMNYD